MPAFESGHSTRTVPEFVDMLRVGKVELVVDAIGILAVERVKGIEPSS